MELFDLHVHSVFSDGRDTPRDIVISAIEKGIKTLGFSDHSYTEFDERYCIQRNKQAEYIRTINELKNEFSDKIEILCATEQDFYSTAPTAGYDYVIGSVHYVFIDGEYIPRAPPRRYIKASGKSIFFRRYFEPLRSVF